MSTREFLTLILVFTTGIGIAHGQQSRPDDPLIGWNNALSGLAVSAADALSAEGISLAQLSRNHSQVRSIRKKLLELDADRWPIPRKIDYLLVLSRANDLDFTYRVVRPWFRDPGFYLDAVRALPHIDLPIEEDKQEEFQKKLELVGGVLENARRNLDGEAAGTLADLALFHLNHYDGVGQEEPLRLEPPPGIVGWYRDLVQRLPRSQPALRAAAERALKAVEDYRDWLTSERGRFAGKASVGLDEFNWYLRHVRLMPYSANDVSLLGERELARSAAFLAIERNKNRNRPALEIAGSKEEYEARVQKAEEHIRSLIRDQELLTIPPDIGPQATDAFWRAGLKRHFWEELQYRDAHNNHIHASIPGHRFDMILASRNGHPIRQTVRDGGRIEGWAFYIEEMLLQAGLLDDNPRAREMFYVALIARAVRIPTELGLQSGELSFEEAIQFMVERVPFMEENLARYDLEIYLRMPTYGMNYVMGRIQLEQLLSERAQQLGETFHLGEFHDQFLSHGLIPISMIRWEMTGQGDEAEALWKELRMGQP